MFRKEVFDQQQGQWLGQIRLNRPPSFAWVTSIALLIATLAVAFVSTFEVARKAKVSGILLPSAGMLEIGSPRSAVVSEVLVREGEIVEAGQVLLRLKSERFTSSGEVSVINANAIKERQSSLESERLLLRQQNQQRQLALANRLDNLRAEEQQSILELETSRLRLQLAKDGEQRFADLAREGFVSPIQAQQKQGEVLDVKLREQNAERSLQALRRDIAALQSDISDAVLTGKTNIERLDRTRAELAQQLAENEAQNGLLLSSPLSAKVSALTIQHGQSVKLGQTLIALIPIGRLPGSSGQSDALEAQLYAPSRTSGFIKAGQTVWLRIAAFPYQKFGMTEGVVSQVSQTPIAAQDLPAGQSQALISAAKTNEPLYRISVKLKSEKIAAYGVEQRLKAGMAVDADIIQEHRTVWEWLLEPIFAVSPPKRI